MRYMPSQRGGKKKMIISVDAEKASDKMQHSFMIKKKSQSNRNKNKNKQMASNQTCKLWHSKVNHTQNEKSIYGLRKKIFTNNV